MVWGFYRFILISGFSHCLGMDKTIAHTNLDNIDKSYNKYKTDMYQMVWCYCYHLHGLQILREFGK